MNFLYIALGGSLGAVARYVVSTAIYANFKQTLPLGTLLVNSTGSLAIGFLFVLLEKAGGNEAMKLVLITGFLGAYTTFSTYSLDTVRLFLDGKFLAGSVNFLLNNGICLLFVFAGIKASKLLWA